MTIVSLVPPLRDDETKAIRFYVPTDPATPDDNQVRVFVTPFTSGDEETILSFTKDFAHLLALKNASENGTVKVQLLRLLLHDEALEMFLQEYKEPDLLDDDEDDVEAINATNLNVAADAAYAAFLTQLLPPNAG